MMKTLFVAASAACLFAQTVSFSTAPKDRQLYPRGTDDSAAIPITGVVRGLGADSATLDVLKDSVPIHHTVVTLAYEGDSARFSFSPRIKAELAEHSVRIYLDATLVLSRDSIVSGDAYLVSGQSNAESVKSATPAADLSEWIRNFGNADGGGGVNDTAWCIYSDGNYLRALSNYLSKNIVDHYGVPALVLNGAFGGTKIEEHVNTLAAILTTRAERAGVKDKVRALFWHQGESSSDSTGWANYPARFDALYHIWKNAYPALEKIYVFQIRPGCGSDYISELMEVQRRIPERYPDIHVMSTTTLPGHIYDYCHYFIEGYKAMAACGFALLARDFYGSTDTVGITPPNILSVDYVTGMHDELELVFDQPVVWTDISGEGYTGWACLRDYFYLDGEWGNVASGYEVRDRNAIRLKLKAPSAAVSLTYLPDRFRNDTARIYEGPWLANERGIGALGFNRFPITENYPETLMVWDGAMPLDSIALSIKQDTLMVLDSSPMTVTGYYSDAGGIHTVAVRSGEVAWESDSASKVQVRSGWVCVSAHAAGPVHVAARVGGKGDTIRVVTLDTIPVLRMNFQADTVPFREGWTSVSTAAYDSAKGYGWTFIYQYHVSNDRPGDNFLFKSYVWPYNGNGWGTGTFKVEVPDGDYILRIGGGDVDNDYSRTTIVCNGDTVINQRAANYRTVATQPVSVEDGGGLTLVTDDIIGYFVLIPAAYHNYIYRLADDGFGDSLAQPPYTVAEGEPAPSPPMALIPCPNPFNPVVRFHVSSGLENPGLRIFDCAGRLVVDLSEEIRKNRAIEWNAGKRASGLYFAVLESADKRLVRKLVLAR